MSKPEDLDKLEKFLEKAVKKQLAPGYHGKKKPELKDLDDAFESARTKAGIDLDQDIEWEPSDALCEALLRDLQAWRGQHRIVGGSPPFDQMYLLVRFAMPLLPTVESEGGAAG